MKGKITILFVIICFFSAIAGNIEPRDVKLFREGENVILSFSAYIPEKTVQANHRLLVTPQLYNDNNTVSMKLFAVTGSKMEKRDKQKKRLNKDKPADSYVNSSNGSTMLYAASIPYEAWMNNTLSLHLLLKEEGCCEVKDLGLIQVEHSVVLPLPHAPVLQEVQPIQSEAAKMSDKYPFLRLIDKDGAGDRSTSVRFRVSSTRLDLSFSSNAENVQKIKEGIRLVNNDEKTRLEKITIVGFASPEGNRKQNLQLSEGRAKALGRHLQQEMNIPEKTFEIQSGGEDWVGLLELVIQSEMNYKNEIIDIITNHPAEKRNERLKQLGGGRPYRSIYDVIYPQLRDACYINVWYSEKEDKAAETINHAISLIATLRYAEALESLLSVEHDPRSWNVIGTCYMLQGDYPKARIWLEKAIAAGDEDAKKNFDLIN